MFGFVFLIVMALIVFIIIRWLFQSSEMFVGGYDEPVEVERALSLSDAIRTNQEFDKMIALNYSPTERVEINLYTRQMSVLY